MITKQFLLYTAIGITSTAVQYAAYLLALFPTNSYDCGVAAGFVCSVGYSFCMNQRFVFPVAERQTRNFWRALLKTYLMYAGTGIFLTGILMHLLIDGMGMSRFLAPIVIVVLIYPLNFLISKFWAYRTENKEGGNR